MPQLQESIADDLQIQSRQTSSQVLQEPANSLQASQRASRSDPNQLHAMAVANMLGHRVTIGIDTSPNDMDAIGGRPESGVISEKVVAADHGVARAHYGRKPSRPSRAVTPLRRVGIAQKHRVVEIEKEAIRRSSEQCQLPGGHQFSLKNH